MRIFLSWSGALSKDIATALTEWLPYVISPAMPWMSDHDIAAGSLWETELHENLEETDCGILILTRENQTSPWVLFEAGVLSKTSHKRRLIPYLIDLPVGAIVAPLVRFQSVNADLQGTRRLVEGLNSALPHPTPKERLATLFEVFWPRLEAKLSEARAALPAPDSRPRPIEAYLEEILSLLHASTSGRSSEVLQQSSPKSALDKLTETIKELRSKIDSMEEYERKGGGASGENWWDDYMERHRKALLLYRQAKDIVEQANGINLQN